MRSTQFLSTCTSYSFERSNQYDWQLQEVTLIGLARWGNSFFRHFYAGKIPCRNAIIPAKHVFTGLTLCYFPELPRQSVFCLQQKRFQHSSFSSVCYTLLKRRIY